MITLFEPTFISLHLAGSGSRCSAKTTRQRLPLGSEIGTAVTLTLRLSSKPPQATRYPQSTDSLPVPTRNLNGTRLSHPRRIEYCVSWMGRGSGSTHTTEHMSITHQFLRVVATIQEKDRSGLFAELSYLQSLRFNPLSRSAKQPAILVKLSFPFVPLTFRFKNLFHSSNNHTGYSFASIQPSSTCPPGPKACSDRIPASSPSSSHPTHSDHASCGPDSRLSLRLLPRGHALDG